MKTLPGESGEVAIMREGNIAGKALVDRMADIDASPHEGALILASMLAQICAQCMRGDQEDAGAMLAVITGVAAESTPLLCEAFAEYYVAMDQEDAHG